MSYGHDRPVDLGLEPDDEDEVEVDSYNLGMDSQHLEVMSILRSIVETQAQILSRLRRLENRNGRTT